MSKTKILFISIIFIFVESSLIQIPLKRKTTIFYITIKIGTNKEINLPFGISKHKSLLANPNCKICDKSYLFNPLNQSIKIQDFQSQKILYYNYTGAEYLDNLSFPNNENLSQIINYISFEDVSYMTKLSSYGYFFLSYTNYNFKTLKKIFGFHFTTNSNLDIGDINTNIIQNLSLLHNYSVKYNENKTEWYIEAEELTINNNRTLKEKQKIAFDISRSSLYIPKKFFFEHMEYVFPISGKCQIIDFGCFLCTCDVNYLKTFSTFNFIFPNNENLTVNPKSYIQPGDTSLADPCLVNININYDTDYWIIGADVLLNYYLLFNVDERIFSLYSNKSVLIQNSEVALIWNFLNIAFIGLFIFGMSKFLRKKKSGKLIIQ